MLTFFTAILFTLGVVESLPTDTLDKRLQVINCDFQFPPVNVIPKSCSVPPPVDKDLKLEDSTVEIYLCLALLDIKSRICEFKNVTVSMFKVDVYDHDDENDHDKFCSRMAKLNSTSGNVTNLFTNLKNGNCFYICFGLAKDKSEIRRALCETLYQGHEVLKQMRSAPNTSSLLNTRTSEGSPKNSVGVQYSAPIPPSKQSSSGASNKQSSALDSTKQNNKADIENGRFVNADEKSPDSIPSNGTDGTRNLQDFKRKGPVQVLKKNTTQDKSIGSPKPETGDLGNKLVQQTKVPNAAQLIGGDDENQYKPPDAPNGLERKPNQESADRPNTGQGKPKKEFDDQDPGALDTIAGKGELNGALDTSNTNIGEDAEETDDENIPEGNHLQGETDDDDDDVGIEDKEKGKGVKVNEAPKIGDQLSSSPNDVLRQSDKTPASGHTYGYSNFVEAEDSHFFAYFMSLSAFFIICYLAYHHKRKIIAMAVEGKKSRNSSRRRPNSASYHKLDSNLEEAMSSNVISTNSYVIY